MTDAETALFNQVLSVYNAILYRPGNEAVTPEQAMEEAKRLINDAMTFAKSATSGD